MNRCIDCKHWDRDGELYEYYDPESDDDELDPASRHRICKRIKLLDRREDPESLQAFTQDASGYMASLWTAPEFGCQLWEENDDTD